MLKGQEIVIFGFGNQGEAQGLNLKDLNLNISVYLRPDSPRIARAREMGFEVITDGREAGERAEMAVLLLPDSEQPEFYNRWLDKHLKKGAALIFAHGLNIHYQLIKPRKDLDVILVAPLGQGNAVRDGFLKGKGVPTMVAVYQDFSGHAWETAGEYANAISGGAHQIKTTFAEEVETDLFAEQAVIVGGLSELIKSGFDTLIEAGYNPEIAYYCTLKEAKYMMDLFAEHGISKTMEKISDTARYGALTRGRQVIDDNVRTRFKNIIDEIRNGNFKNELALEILSGHQRSAELMKELKHHLINQIHERLNAG